MPTLRLTSAADRPVLLRDGEELMGLVPLRERARPQGEHVTRSLRATGQHASARVTSGIACR